jgi:hypothetical protein
MDIFVPRLRIEVDALIAEAKRRMHRRWLLAGVAALVVAAAVTLVLQPWDRGPQSTASVGTSGRGIAQIPGMTRVLSTGVGNSVCAGMKGTSLPQWCSTIKLLHGRYEAWILTTAYKRGSRLNVSGIFARAHPGPVLVTDKWLRLASAQQAEQLLREPDFNESYTGRPASAVNGGAARLIGGAHSNSGVYFAGSRTPAQEFEFFWASGPTVVNVNVVGARLTVAEAQQIALLASPR